MDRKQHQDRNQCWIVPESETVQGTLLSRQDEQPTADRSTDKGTITVHRELQPTQGPVVPLWKEYECNTAPLSPTETNKMKQSHTQPPQVNIVTMTTSIIPITLGRYRYSKPTTPTETYRNTHHRIILRIILGITTACVIMSVVPEAPSSSTADSTQVQLLFQDFGPREVYLHHKQP